MCITESFCCTAVIKHNIDNHKGLQGYNPVTVDAAAKGISVVFTPSSSLPSLLPSPHCCSYSPGLDVVPIT